MSPEDLKKLSSSDLFPYPLARIEQGDDVLYSFTTAQGVKYEITFKSDAKYFQESSGISHLFYSFVLTRIGNKIGVADDRIKATVVYSLNAVFEANPELVITYQCSTKNYQQRARARLFDQWYEEYGQNYRQIRYINQSDSSDIYAAAIYRESNPHSLFIEELLNDVFDNK